jgi:hypothetical protein
VVCGKAAEPCAPGESAPPFIRAGGVWKTSEACWLLLENGLEREERLAFRAVCGAPARNSHEIFPNNLGPVGHFEARREVRGLWLIGVVRSAALGQHAQYFLSAAPMTPE